VSDPQRKQESCPPGSGANAIHAARLTTPHLYAAGTMQNLEDLMTAKYAEGNHGWFGHSTRITVRGHAVKTSDTGEDPAK